MTDVAEKLYERLLVLRFQAGDEAAFAELVERYHFRLRYFVRKILGELDCSDDVVQDVWFDVFRQANRLRDASAFATWVYRIAHDRACRTLRRRGVQYVSIEEAAIVADSTSEADFSAEEIGRIHAGMDALPFEQREALVLRFIEEMSYEDIARVVGCPVGTVRSRIHYAKQSLRVILERTQLREPS